MRCLVISLTCPRRFGEIMITKIYKDSRLKMAVSLLVLRAVASV